MRPLGTALALAVQRLMLRTSQTPLRGVWSFAHGLAIRGVARTLALASNGSVYVKGSFGYGDPVYGVSDIDLVVVVPSGDVRAASTVKRRWGRLIKLFPPLRELFHLFIYDSASLRDALSAPCFTFGLADDPPRAGFLGPDPLTDEMGLQERPELYGAPTEWRLVAGRPAGIAPAPDDADNRRFEAWLELQFWWRYLFPVSIDPVGPRLPYLCVKLVAEPARIWLWLTRGQQVFSRVEALEEARRALPSEEEAFRRALELHRRLPHSPEPPLDEFLPHFVRLSSLIAAEIGRQLEPGGATEVQLTGDPHESIVEAGSKPGFEQLPLVDWRARAVPPPPDEVFVITDGDPQSRLDVAAAAIASSDGPYLALRAEQLLVFPAARTGGRSHGADPESGAARWSRVKLRGIQCPMTDPVSFALADHTPAAQFPNADGWSARDSARRAVAEHGAWLAGGRRDGPVRGWVAAQTSGAPQPAVELGRLFTAARAALFLESLHDRPALPLTVRAVGEALGERAEVGRALARETVEAYAAWRVGGSEPADQLVEAFAASVAELPAYRR